MSIPAEKPIKHVVTLTISLLVNITTADNNKQMTYQAVGSGANPQKEILATAEANIRANSFLLDIFINVRF